MNLLDLTVTLLQRRDDTSGEDAEDKEPAVAFKGRRTANSQGRRKGRVTRSMANEVEENSAPPANSELCEFKIQSGSISFPS